MDLDTRETTVEEGGTALRMTDGSARSFLLTIFGEYVYPKQDLIWTSTLLSAFASVGIADRAARQAIGRAASSGWIEPHREGRRTAWRMTAHGKDMISEGSRRVRSVREAAKDWDGTWVIVHVTLPESQRGERRSLYRSLNWLGFGSPAQGLWICPHADRLEAVVRRVVELDLAERAIGFHGRAVDLGISEPTLIAQAWNLAEIAAIYEALIQRFSRQRPRTSAATFAAHMRLVNTFQRLPAFDPGLPRPLLPEDWPGMQAARRLDDLREQWRSVAHAHWAELTELD